MCSGFEAYAASARTSLLGACRVTQRGSGIASQSECRDVCPAAGLLDVAQRLSPIAADRHHTRMRRQPAGLELLDIDQTHAPGKLTGKLGIEHVYSQAVNRS